MVDCYEHGNEYSGRNNNSLYRESAALRFKPNSTVQEKQISQDSSLAVWLNVLECVLGTQIICAWCTDNMCLVHR
jgi:hypothetical protein